MTKPVKIVIITIASVIFILCVAYLGLAYYYSHTSNTIGVNEADYSESERCFTYGTYVNNIYATGMTAKQVEEELDKRYSDVEELSFSINGEKFKISLEDIDYNLDYQAALKNAIHDQSPLEWGFNLLNTQYINVEPTVIFDEGKFDSKFEALNLNNVINNSGELYIYYDEELGYVLYDGKTNAYNISKIKDLLLKELKAGETCVEISEDCKNEVRYSDHDEYLLKYYDLLSNKMNKELSYRFGKENLSMKGKGWATLYNCEEIIDKITPSMVKADMQVEGIDFDVDLARVEEFLTCFLDEYNTYNNRHFITHDGSEVYVKAGNYGNQIDLASEAKWLLDYIENDNTVLYRTPDYKIKANFPEKNDFGETFIEIDLDCQRMWYYVDGKTYVDTNVVTGSFYNGTSCTSPRVVSVYTIIPNKWLNGPTWHCFVKYWVAIQGAIGIHDASWRTDWTDDAYRTGAGSHGCINTPESEMKKIFEHVQIGTPVIVYSHKINGIEDKE